MTNTACEAALLMALSECWGRREIGARMVAEVAMENITLEGRQGEVTIDMLRRGAQKLLAKLFEGKCPRCGGQLE